MSVEAWLAEGFMDRHPEDAAHVLERYPPAEAAALFQGLPEDVVARVLERMVTVVSAACLEKCAPEFAVGVFSNLHTPRALSILRSTDPIWGAGILDRLSGTEARVLKEQLTYDSDSAAALVDFTLLTLADDITVGEANELFRRNPHRAHYYLYVVDRDSRLRGVITLRELALHASEEFIANIMNRHLSFIVASETRAAVIGHASWREFSAMPVVDESGVFIGMIRHETVKMVELDFGSSEEGLTMVGKAMGELYFLGLNGMMQALGSAFSARRKSRPDNDK